MHKLLAVSPTLGSGTGTFLSTIADEETWSHLGGICEARNSAPSEKRHMLTARLILMSDAHKTITESKGVLSLKRRSNNKYSRDSEERHRTGLQTTAGAGRWALSSLCQILSCATSRRFFGDSQSTPFCGCSWSKAGPSPQPDFLITRTLHVVRMTLMPPSTSSRHEECRGFA